jgi:hypothetical protein
MAEVAVSKDAVLSRISGIVDSLMQSESVYREELQKDEIMQIFSRLLDKVSPEEIMPLDDERLTQRVRRVMGTQLMTRLLDGLSPEQVDMFNAAVEGR